SIEPDTYGWRFREREGSMPDRAAAVSYRTSSARMAVGAQQFGNVASGTGEIEGAVAMMDGGVFFANRIDDAFAVVNAKAPNVDVYYENRPVGRTNSRGQLLVPRLRSYEDNKLSIDPTNLPLDARIPRTRASVKPSDRSGVVVDFGVETDIPSTLFILRDAKGA